MIATIPTNDTFFAMLNSLTNKYEVALQDLEQLSNLDVETRLRARTDKVQEISLDIANDLTYLTKYRLGQDTKYNSYNLKYIDSAIAYLRDLRQTLSLYLTAEKL